MPQRSAQGLACWFRIGHRRYRLLLTQLLLAGSVGSGLAYLDNYLLSALTRSLTLAFGERSAASGAQAAGSGDLVGPFVPLADTFAISLPIAVLAAFVVARLLAAAIAFWRARAAGALQIKSRNDLESEILVHLLRKDDTFFSSHSPAETVNRLTVDVHRVSQRRPNLMTAWWSALLIVGNLAFFLQRDWRLAIVGLVSCAAGAWWTYRITRNVSGFDRQYLTQDDRVKSLFEDYLRAAPEIQISQLFAKVRAQFVDRQAGRSEIFVRYVSLKAMLKVANIVSALGAFAAMIAILLWMSEGNEGRAAALVLVPAVIWALPSLFSNAAELIFLNLDFQIARTSMDRLLEYETAAVDDGSAADGEAEAAGADDEAAEPLELKDVSYQYTGSDGTQQGGVVGVSTVIQPGRWTAVVGGAGSGKSTLLKLLLGRYQPQRGSVSYGDSPLEEHGASLSQKLALMPQSLALLNANIRDNLMFGKRDASAGASLDEADLAVVEAIGLGKVCRLKALELQPAKASSYQAIAGDIEAIRKRIRSTLVERCEVTIAAYEDAMFDPRHWLIESLVAGRCARGKTIAALLGDKGDCQPLRELAGSKLCRDLSPLGRRVLTESQNLLRLSSYHLYAQLAPMPLDERLWKLRSSHVHLADGEPAGDAEVTALFAIALTSAPVECSAEAEAESQLSSSSGSADGIALDALKALLGDRWSPFELDRVHPHLSWRDNLIFGAVDVPNSRTGRLVDATLLELLSGDELNETFSRLGLDVEVGRQGGNLSGGQGQLVALCRALLRRSAVVVLDEPTSALDPASRTTVSDFLSSYKNDRIVITVSHDPEFVRHADDIRLMEGGRLVASGGFDELQQESEAFRNIMRQS